MIGNDIVDLQTISSSSNWNRTRFFDKSFTKFEQNVIFNSNNYIQTTWLIWSMKEAAYKLFVQEFGRRFFNPKALQCQLITDKTGIVSYDEFKVFTSSERNENFVYTTAVKSVTDPVKSVVINSDINTYKNQSANLKKKVLEYIAIRKALELNHLKVIKNTLGVPQILFRNELLPLHISLTHCGRFCGFSIMNS